MQTELNLFVGLMLAYVLDPEYRTEYQVWKKQNKDIYRS